MADAKEFQKNLSFTQYGVSAVPAHTHNGIDSLPINFKSVYDAPRNFCIAVNTNGTTAVNVFGGKSFGYPITITGVYLISLDTTAGNITLLNNGNTVATIAKGTTAGAMVGATSLANTVVSPNVSFTAVSSSAGNATLFVTFNV